MPLTANQLLLSSLVASASGVMAEPTKVLAVSVDYRVSEQSPDRIEAIAADLCARALWQIPRVSQVRSRFNHGAFSIEVFFDDGAGAVDMVAVENEIDRLRLGDRLDIAARSIRLAPPRHEDASF